ncbi:WYL domain-containing protein [Salininema proteolyticum]|uniref:Uncharacterized protein n=1 Tax=Salininema proteolyticum TaxID=1607685 RepID=A0ABV8TUX2_9ACTN
MLSGVGVRALPYRAKVRLHAPAEAMADKFPPSTGVLEAVDAENCVLGFGGASYPNMAGFLGIGFTVPDPPDLAEGPRELSWRFHTAAGYRPAGSWE